MDSAERNEAHEAACAPHRGLYQAQINGCRHSPAAPALRGPIPGLLGLWGEQGKAGSHWQSYSLFVVLCCQRRLCVYRCVCVCLACFNQVFPTANTQRLVERCGAEELFSGEQKIERGRTRVGAAHSASSLCGTRFSRPAPVFPAVKLADSKSLKPPTLRRVHTSPQHLPGSIAPLSKHVFSLNLNHYHAWR